MGVTFKYASASLVSVEALLTTKERATNRYGIMETMRGMTALGHPETKDLPPLGRFEDGCGPANIIVTRCSLLSQDPLPVLERILAVSEKSFVSLGVRRQRRVFILKERDSEFHDPFSNLIVAHALCRNPQPR